MKPGEIWSFFKQNVLTITGILGVVFGIITGLCLKARPEPYSEREVMYIGFFGNLYLQLLKCIVIPLVIPSVIVAVGSLDIKSSSKYFYISSVRCKELTIFFMFLLRSQFAFFPKTDV